jgi:hypothetical protein
LIVSNTNKLARYARLAGLSARVVIVVLLIRFGALSLQKVVTHNDQEDITPLMTRYHRLEPSVRVYRIVGFVSDAQGNEFQKRSFAAQYTIAPTLIDRTPHCCEVTIGDFVNSLPPEEYTIIRTFGDGLYLLEAHQ